MSSKTSEFRLQRLTKTFGTRDTSVNSSYYEPKQTLKLAAMNSISLGVKHNDLSFISGRDLNKLRPDPQVYGNIQYASASLNMSQTRKKYDSVYQQKTSRDSSISKLRDQKIKYSIFEGQLLDKKEEGKKKVENMQKSLQKNISLFTEVDVQGKVLENMRIRLKTDRVVLDQRKFDLQKQLKFLKKQKQVLVLDKDQITGSEDRTNKIYKKFVAQLNAEKTERNTHLQSLETMVAEKQRMNIFNGQRTFEMKEIAERALLDKDQEQLNWEKLYLSNKVVSKILRDKMDKQMRKFFVTESAFKTIKIATGVSDGDTLVQKFLNKETAYGDLLGKIAENQKLIQTLKIQREELIKEEKELDAEKQVIDGTKRVEVSVDKQIKILQQVEQREKRVKLQKQKLREWVVKSIKKTNNVLGIKTQKTFTIQRDHKNIAEGFITYLKQIQELIKETDTMENEKQQIFKNENMKKKGIVRVRQSSQPEEDSQNEAVQQQSHLLIMQRQQLMNSNDKFMKQVKIKHEEKRKALAEALMPKKKDIAPPPKAVQPID